MLNSIKPNRILLVCTIIVFLTVLTIILFQTTYSAWAKEYPIDIRDFGAKGDGKTDDTSAFQNALEKAGENGGVVSVPPGQYRLNGIISIPEGVALEGSWPGPHPSQLDKGSTLLAYSGRDEEDETIYQSEKWKHSERNYHLLS